MAQRSPRYKDERPVRRRDDYDRRPYERDVYPDRSRRYQEYDPVRDTRPSKSRRRKKKGHGGIIAAVIILLIVAAAVVLVFVSGILNKTPEQILDTRPVPSGPKVIETASIGVTGDILLHMPILNMYGDGNGNFDFSYIFQKVAPVYEQTDLMIANLEVTLGGPEYGEYSSYPSFNSPDAIVPALKNAGVDICLTANNHSNDTGYWGMMRTLQVLDDYGVDHLGTRESGDEKYLMVRSINGIRMGMICYTYDTREDPDDEISLNGVVLSGDAANSVNTFSYAALDEFYEDMERQLYYMDMLDLDVKIVFIHWGSEYEDYPNNVQESVAQRLCDMGVDVIVGGHPHVVQAFDTLTSADGHQTICLYSMGNELSNQRKELMNEDDYRGYTEDGLVIQITFEKFNNGKVKVGAVNIVPTWVDGFDYQIMALNGEEDPNTWGTSDVAQAKASYNRTMERLGEGYISFRAAKNQSAVNEYLN